jgi:hypothetical protein
VPQADAIPGQPQPGHGETILIVDDEQSMLDASRQIMGNLGYRVGCCSPKTDAGWSRLSPPIRIRSGSASSTSSCRSSAASIQPGGFAISAPICRSSLQPAMTSRLIRRQLDR